MNRQPDPKDRNILQMIRDDLSAFYNLNIWTRAVSYLLVLISLGVIVYRLLKWIVSEVVDLAGTIQRATPTLTPIPDLQLTPTPISTIWVPPPEVDEFVQELIAPDNIRHCLVVVLALILALQLAVAYLTSFYKIDKLSTSAALILKSMFLISLGKIIINEKAEMSEPEDDNAPILRVGGPGRVEIAPGSGAVFQSVDGEFRVIGPSGPKSAKILPFEKLYRVIDLRDHDIVLNIQSRTRDGKFGTLKDVKFSFSVFRGHQAAQPTDPYAYDSNALINLVRNYWLEGEYQSFAQGLIESDLRQFVTTRTLSDISPHPSPSLFRDFERKFNAQTQERGIQIRWTGSAAGETSPDQPVSATPPAPSPPPAPSTPPSPVVSGPTTSIEKLYKDILVKTGGDKILAQRLIKHERQQAPDLNLAVWLQNAIIRWEHDNR